MLLVSLTFACATISWISKQCFFTELALITFRRSGGKREGVRRRGRRREGRKGGRIREKEGREEGRED